MTQNTHNDLLDKNSADQKPGGDTTSLFVSLYLIILAFFMVLNSISNQSQTKVKSATDSVTRAFDSPFEPDADFVDVTGDDTNILPNDEFYEQLRGVFASLVGFEGRFPTQGGNVIRVEFDQSTLYQDESSEFKNNQQAFLTQLANFLNDEGFGTKREVEYIIYSGDQFPAGPSYWTDISILRSGALVSRMTQMGVREDQLSIGVAPGEDDKLEISFSIRDAVTSRQDLRDTDRRGLGEATVPMRLGDF